MLHGLEQDGALTSRRKMVNGRSRVYYMVTPAGLRRFAERAQALTDFSPQFRKFSQEDKMARLFDELVERLLRAGVAPRHVRRYLRELGDHLADLRAEEEHAGKSRAMRNRRRWRGWAKWKIWPGQ